MNACFRPAVGYLLTVCTCAALAGFNNSAVPSLSSSAPVRSGNPSHDTVPAAKGERLYSPDAQLKKISSQFSFTEGPTVNRNGDIYFTDQPNDKIWKYAADGTLSLFMEKTGRSNGLYFDKKGNLLSCADEKDELWSISPDKKITVLVRNFQGHRLNGPNDLWVDPKGGVYLTDPYYPRDYWDRTQPDIVGEKVYYLPPGKKELVMADSSLSKPNGIVGTPDGKYLYVADIKANKIYRFSIGGNGSLTDRQVFAQQGSDGITLDSKGNLYLCGNGVTIYNPAGEKIAHIDVPAKWTANLCFGGKNRTDLFLTASESIYVFPMEVKGVE